MLTRSRRRAVRPAWVALATLVALLILHPRQAGSVERQALSGGYELSGPHRHDNLTIFLIHGPDRVRPGRLITLEEALKQNKAVVHETGEVGQLLVENRSHDTEVFIQSGDIVKGGRQDRLISFDLVLPPRSGKVAVVSLCVDQGRWQQRGKEAVTRFSSSTGQLPSKMLKIHGGNYGQFGALGGQFGQLGQLGGNLGNLGGQFGLAGGTGRGQLGQLGNLGGGQLGVSGVAQFGQLGGQFGQQGGVWNEIGQLQGRLQAKIGSSVQSKASPSSLQLTLEHPRVEEAIEKYTRPLAEAVSDHKDVVGYAFAINGKVNSVEVYGNAELFAKLWPKLLRANALEAFLEHEKGKRYSDVTEQTVRAVLVDAERGALTTKDINRRVQVQMRETPNTLLFETQDRARGTWLHRSYLTK
ncbi:MAG TPA: DUF6569 family protein [Gemmataceae bacterium]|nr:DUF6569 family protein [Gemmataceae bacterium]